jgi:hypothetical protein
VRLGPRRRQGLAGRRVSQSSCACQLRGER